MNMIEPLLSIQQLPAIPTMRHNAKAIALLDAIILPEWEYRYFSYNGRWSGEDGGGEEMASMRNGEGGHYFVLFNSDGAAGNCRCGATMADVDSELERVPDVFESFRSEPAFSIRDSTYFFWRVTNDSTWQAAPADRDDFPLIGLLVGDPRAYQRYASEYAEVDLPLAPIEAVFDTLTIDADILAQLNPELSVGDLAADVAEITGA